MMINDVVSLFWDRFYWAFLGGSKWFWGPVIDTHTHMHTPRHKVSPPYNECWMGWNRRLWLCQGVNLSLKTLFDLQHMYSCVCPDTAHVMVAYQRLGRTAIPHPYFQYTADLIVAGGGSLGDWQSQQRGLKMRIRWSAPVITKPDVQHKKQSVSRTAMSVVFVAVVNGTPTPTQSIYTVHLSNKFLLLQSWWSLQRTCNRGPFTFMLHKIVSRHDKNRIRHDMPFEKRESALVYAADFC